MTTPDGSAAGATAASYTTNYTYDQAWNLATVTGPPAPVRTYSAQTAVTARPVSTYGYDSFGDRTQAKGPGRQRHGHRGTRRAGSPRSPSPPTPARRVLGAHRGHPLRYNGRGTWPRSPTRPGTPPRTPTTLGDLTARTDPQLPGQSAPGQWTYTYDAAGEQLSATSPLSEKTQATWNYFREQATATDALNSTAHYSYDYLGDQTQVTTPDGRWPPPAATTTWASWPARRTRTEHHQLLLQLRRAGVPGDEPGRQSPSTATTRPGG